MLKLLVLPVLYAVFTGRRGTALPEVAEEASADRASEVHA